MKNMDKIVCIACPLHLLLLVSLLGSGSQALTFHFPPYQSPPCGPNQLKNCPTPVLNSTQRCNPEDRCRGFFLSLQSGSGILVPTTANFQRVREAIVAGYLAFLSDKKMVNGSEQWRILIGLNSQISAEMFQFASHDIAELGVNVQYSFRNLSSTPAMFNAMLTEDEAFDGFVNITASDPRRNWGKLMFFTNAGRLGEAEVRGILKHATNMYSNFRAETYSEKNATVVELMLRINKSDPDLKGRSFQDYGKDVLKHLNNSIASDSELQMVPSKDGVQAFGFEGWFRLMLSPHHDPALLLHIEAPRREDTLKLGLAVDATLKKFHALDRYALDKFVQFPLN